MNLPPLLIARVNARIALMKRQVAAIPRRFADFLREVDRSPSPVVEAIADASQGIPITSIDDATCEVVFGCKRSELPDSPRRVVDVRAGGRGGKTSRLLAPMAIFAALTVALPTLASGEHAWSLVVAPDKTLAGQALSFARGIIEATPWLRAMVANRTVSRGTERIGNSECITIRRADGKLVDIRIGVASSGGKWARGKTFVFVGFDEAAFFQADSEKVANDRDLFQAAIQRIVPDGQLWMVSTPWIEGYGVMEEHIANNWGTHEFALIAQGPTRLLNPTWDPDGTIEKHLRATDPDNAAREIDAIPLPAGSKVFFPPEVLKLAINTERALHLDWLPSSTHYGATDLGLRKNSSTLAISRREMGKVRLAYHEEIRPKRGEPLDPNEVCQGFGKKLAEYAAWAVEGDLHYAETARREFAKVRVKDPLDSSKERGITYLDFDTSVENVSRVFGAARDLMAGGQADIPDAPRLISQLRLTTSKPMPGGSIKVVLPRVGNAHGDLAMVSVMSMAAVPMSDAAGSSVVRKKRSLDGGIGAGGGF